MSTETFKYVNISTETTLRSDYGGDAIQNNGDSREVYDVDLTLRHIMNGLDWPSKGVDQICQIGDDGVSNWMKISDDLYPAISSRFTTAELATVVSSAPAGYSDNSRTSQFSPRWDKTNIYVHGDSIEFGLGTSSGDYTDTYMYQGMEMISGYADTYSYRSTALGSSSFANTDAGHPNGYPEKWTTSYNQRHRTLPLNATGLRTTFVIGLGTNDIAYDAAVDGADTYDRLVTRLAQMRADFPNIVIIVTTIFKRSGNANHGLDYNTPLRANYLTIGADILLDLDLELGDFDSGTYTTDGVHLTTAGHALLATISRDAILAADVLHASGGGGGNYSGSSNVTNSGDNVVNLTDNVVNT